MPRPFLSAIGASHLFGIIVDGSSVAAPKPAPDVYLEAARRLSARPQECVAVEDSPVGIVSALDAGMEVHALTTTCDRRALVQAHHVHDSAQALRRALLRGHQPR
jgi:beta-phosphoglucomutase-like phosphatase (HAD superfamily)